MFGIERRVDLSSMFGAGVDAVEELASASLLHDVRTRPPREIAEPVRAVHDRVSRDLRVAQHEVAVCEQTIMHQKLYNFEDL